MNNPLFTLFKMFVSPSTDKRMILNNLDHPFLLVFEMSNVNEATKNSKKKLVRVRGNPFNRK